MSNWLFIVGGAVALGLFILVAYRLGTMLRAPLPHNPALSDAEPPECCYKADLARPETWDDCVWPVCSCDRRRRLATSLDEDKRRNETTDARIIREALAPAPIICEECGMASADGNSHRQSCSHWHAALRAIEKAHVGDIVDWGVFHKDTTDVLDEDNEAALHAAIFEAASEQYGLPSKLRTPPTPALDVDQIPDPTPAAFRLSADAAAKDASVASYVEPPAPLVPTPCLLHERDGPR